MRKLLLLFALLLNLKLYSQVIVLSGDFLPPPLPIDTISNPQDSIIKTNKLYICRGDNTVSKFCETKNTSDLIVYNHLKPKYLKIGDYKIDLICKSNDWLDFTPFTPYFADSIVTYKTKTNIEVDLVYTGRLIESIILYVDIFKETIISEATKHYSDNSLDKQSIVSTWIKKTFLGKYSIPEEEFFNQITTSDKVIFYYTNRTFYID